MEEPDTKLQERSLPQTWPALHERMSREWGCKNQSFLSLHLQSVHVCPSYPTSAAVYILNPEHWTGLWPSTTFCMDKYVTHDVMMELDFWVWHFDNIRIGHCIGTAIYSFESPCSSVCNSNVFSAATEMRIWIVALRYDCLFHIAAMHRGFSRSWHLSSWIHPMQVQWASATELHSVRWVRWLCLTNPGSCRGARRICVKALDAHRRTVLQCTYRQRNDTTW